MNAGTLNDIVKDKEEELRAVRDKYEYEMLKARADEDGKKNPSEDKKKDKKKKAFPPGGDDGQAGLASERLLNLPVVSKSYGTVEKKFDRRV
jgi:hypothetical protein